MGARVELLERSPEDGRDMGGRLGRAGAGTDPGVVRRGVMWHIGFWWDHAYAQCFGERDAPATGFDWSEAASATPWPGDVASAVRWLNECHDRWVGALGPLSQVELDSTERSRWFADGSLSLGHVLAWANIELMKNAAEIGALRHLRNADRG
ncbi:hypothetical protein GCM10017673_55830 [Streptosporangium violaceochromogenes]|nr:hypothetical protein GCM10017673_55830 [Streptosporangium violaceochromogenes]